jgi:hypothetical protein
MLSGNQPSCAKPNTGICRWINEPWLREWIAEGHKQGPESQRVRPVQILIDQGFGNPAP